MTTHEERERERGKIDASSSTFSSSILCLMVDVSLIHYRIMYVRLNRDLDLICWVICTTIYFLGGEGTKVREDPDHEKYERGHAR